MQGLKALLTGRFYKGDRPEDVYTTLHRWQLSATYSLTLTALAENKELKVCPESKPVSLTKLLSFRDVTGRFLINLSFTFLT